MKKFQCSMCGYICDEQAPDKCPKCGASKDKFVELDETKTKLIDRSQYTNLLHMDLIITLESVLDLCKEGIEDNLDPACLDVFTKCHKSATEFIQMSKAEIQTHISKGKWG